MPVIIYSTTQVITITRVSVNVISSKRLPGIMSYYLIVHREMSKISVLVLVSPQQTRESKNTIMALVPYNVVPLPVPGTL